LDMDVLLTVVGSVRDERVDQAWDQSLSGDPPPTLCVTTPATSES
jgi:hypothetical protein